MKGMVIGMAGTPHVQCDCGQSIAITPSTTTIYTPSGVTLNGAWVEAECPKCGEYTTADVTAEELAPLAAMGLAIAEPIAHYKLTPRLEMECRNFAVVLANTPPDLLIDALTAPPVKTVMPQRWTNE